MTELFHRPGFLGTSANLAADATLVAMLVIGALFTVGAVLARRGRYETHRWVQTGTAVINLILVAWMMILPYRDFILPGFPERIGETFYLSTTLHAFVGLAAILFGSFVVLRGNGLVPDGLTFQNYKPMMRIAYGLYMAAIVLGIWVY
ncbi:MAG TPA: hypothetical protein VJ768_02235, partial [Anaerolineales bacterium]|nr:hypothetical protein [Anaerolineales bacterium]